MTMSTMQAGELWTRWSVRLAMALYVASLLLQIAGRGRQSSVRLSRSFWTSGCLAYLVHVACAFHFFHHWSHGHAYAETARQTQDVIGWHWGGGLYVNYAFTLIWIADAGWWWAWPASYGNRSRWLAGAIHGFMAFVAFNAVVVFADGFTRWFGVAGCVLLGVALYMEVVKAATRRC